MAIEESASSACAREMRGTMSIASTFTFFAASSFTNSGFCAGQRKLTRVCPAVRRAISAAFGAFTL